MSTAFVTVKIVCRALINRHGLDVHIHHHHWYHGNEDEKHCPDQDVEALQKTVAQKNSHSKGESIAIGEPLTQIAELPDSPAPARCELPAYQESEVDVSPPRVKEKPALHFRVSDYIA
ncbi:hypothetical protein FLAG1_09469 [Fusarium langsethiae]|uniref:Uncharacterized protein n=2 Tax=Fusarium sambucinum species complex TaxID=569360 RepID=A0A0N0DC51_FUSLA|nr:hypothetical protein FLAG1_09469 [Fusarium langsethiae]OBS20556.1 hypothetical protein FPOA_06914 [Fusarium poae]GKU06775.1 unnamed protein product [Fusarium langsethiae]